MAAGRHGLPAARAIAALGLAANAEPLSFNKTRHPSIGNRFMKYQVGIFLILTSAVFLSGCASPQKQAAPPPPVLAQKPDIYRGMHVYAAYCAECHDSGKQGAPSLDDVDEWDSRRMPWSAQLQAHPSHGFLNGPAKGGRAVPSDQNISDAMYYMEAKIKANDE